MLRMFWEIIIQSWTISPYRTVHVEKKHCCSHCGLKFLLTYTLENHIEKEHTEKTNVQQKHDSEKNQSPKSDSNSLNHETDFSLNYKNNVKYFENKGKKPFQCDICKKIFSHKIDLTWHSEKAHDCKKYSKCGPCNINFTTVLQEGSLWNTIVRNIFYLF